MGTATAPVTVQVVDNGDAGYSTSGSWSTSGSGFQGDYQWSALGSGSDVARWMFAVSPGQYEVAATWVPATNRATNAPFTVEDGASMLSTVALNQELTPDDFIDQGVGWELMGTFTINSGTLTVELSDAANEYVIADGIRIDRVGEVPTGPEIQVTVDGADLADDVGNVDFGSTPEGSAITKTFTVTNAGASALTLVEPIGVPTGFSLASSFAATTVAPGGTTTFAIQYDAVSAGTSSGQVSFVNNDADEDPFNFSVTGTATAPVTVQVIDNGDAGYTSSGGWSTSGSGFQGDHQWSALGSGSDVASWTFAASSGQYEVAATWGAAANRATNSPFTIEDGGSVLSTVAMNQELAPNDFTDQGVAWELLGTFTITSGTLTVELSDAANEYVIADGVRIERVGEVPTGPEIQVTVDGADVADDVGNVDFGSTTEGNPITKTFTVMNVGASALTLVEPIGVPTGFSLASSFVTTTVAPGATTTFAVQYDATSAGTSSGQVSFGSNDADEDPFNFSVTATATAPVTVQVIDNGDAGYSTSGTWSTSTSGGFLSDYQWSAKGSGADVARWTFAVGPGQYDVAATWVPAANRATNSPFTVEDGSTLLSTVAMNQELAPDDFSDQGVGWEMLGTFTITSGILTVELSDAANQFVIADAVRVERVGTSASATSTGPQRTTKELALRLLTDITKDELVNGKERNLDTVSVTPEYRFLTDIQDEPLLGSPHLTNPSRSLQRHAKHASADPVEVSDLADEQWNALLTELAHDVAPYFS